MKCPLGPCPLIGLRCDSGGVSVTLTQHNPMVFQFCVLLSKSVGPIPATAGVYHVIEKDAESDGPVARTFAVGLNRNDRRNSSHLLPKSFLVLTSADFIRTDFEGSDAGNAILHRAIITELNIVKCAIMSEWGRERERELRVWEIFSVFHFIALLVDKAHLNFS